MGHALILGVTQSGKTTCAKHLASRLSRVAVFARYDSEWGKGKIFFTDNMDKLARFAELNIKCNIFIDESGEGINRDDSSYQFLATRSRHFGHRVFFITQRAKQLTPNIRTNCESLYCFRQSAYDSKILADEFADEAFLRAPNLARFHYLEKATPFSPVVEKVIQKFC